ncbi:MAG: hydroxymethylbilane synthase [Actinomycetota bacterium]
MALRLATRGSKLALAQAGAVAELLDDAELVEASSDGEPGDKSRFVRAVERELLEGRAEIGVHSAKDLPAALPEGLVIAGVPARETAEDAWLGKGSTLDGVPERSTVGTSSLRRRAQLLARRPDLDVVELHGNVDTRLRRLKGKKLDAIVLAAAGLRRLGREKDISFLLDAGQMTPAAGQGALALQTREDDAEAREAAAAISDDTALVQLTAERAAVAALDASCNTPIGIHARRDGDRLAIDGFAGLPDGSIWVRDRFEGDAADPRALGEELAKRMLAAGAGHILQMAEEQVTQS